MAARIYLVFLFLLVFSNLSSALYEDQVGLADWHQRYIGKAKQAVFHSHKTGRKRVIVSTEENVIASLDLRTGEIFWRHVLGQNDSVNHVDIAHGKYVVTLSSEGSVLRAWNLPDGQLIWESVLQFSASSRPLLYVPRNSGLEKDAMIFVTGGGWLHAISSIDGEIIWKKELSTESLDFQLVFKQDDNDSIYAVGLLDSSDLVVYHISAKNGEFLRESKTFFPGGFCGSMALVSEDILVALDSTTSIIVVVDFSGSSANFQQTYISGLIPEFSGIASLVPLKLSGLFALRIDSTMVLVQVSSLGELVVIDKFIHPIAISDSLSVSEGDQAFAIVENAEARVHIRVKIVNDFPNDILIETVEIDPQRGHVQKVFINNYVRTDRSNGFRALLVMEDHTLLLVQQGKIVWSREDALASVIDSTTFELPVEKDGVSVAKVEHNLFEWLKGHMLKLKGTLMLATPADIAAIQQMRLKSSQKTKMTRDHNGFRKLIIVLTKAGKLFALHSGDGHVVWFLIIMHWRRTLSVLVVAKCGLSDRESFIFSIVDSYTEKEQSSQNIPNSILLVIPLPFTDQTEQRLHLVIDSDFDAHLFPRTADSVNIFLREISNIYWFSADASAGIIKGYSVQGKCKSDMKDVYCFGTRELWSIVFPSHSEKLATIASRKMNEVVHTQAKVIADQDVMYKFISKKSSFVSTVAPKAAEGIGLVTPDEAWVVSENWVVYHYFNLRAHRYEMSVIEIYDESRSDNNNVFKLALGKHNLTSPISSYSRPDVMVKSQSYFFTHSVKAMTVTTTAKGITSKQLLVGTIADQVLALDKRYLDPRRSAEPTQSEKEEGIIPLTDSLPTIPQSYATHSLQVEGLRGIVTFPTKLESTTLVFSYGIDLFFTRIAPSRTYDSLTDEFSYGLLLLTIAALLIAILITWILSEKKELRDKWR
ncbi:hypothetical protein HPP92_003539 [Vanilla planifolia]|uniref:ER membrane protein complex subunit 1 n=1 Tax=Vanilla planifolia TaxID=51239 RepID=A0A835VLK8_VANPL|nr:hypothetical protein HPP92_003539 [Vanilla planifolia]